MNFILKKEKVNLNEIKIGGQSLVGVNALFYPFKSGNYFSILYKNNNCNIINMNSENFNEIQKKQKLKKINLIEILYEDNTSTDSFLLYSKKLSPDWYLENLYFYGTKFKSNETIDENQELTNFLLEKKYAINYLNHNKKELDIKEEMTKIIKNRYGNYKHKFNFLDKEDKNMLDLRKKVSIQNQRNFEDNKYYIDILSVRYQFTFTDYGNLYMYSKCKEDYINRKILGYSIFDEKEKSFEHFIIVNDKLLNFVNEIIKFEDFKKKCDNMSDNGKFKFYNLIDKEKQEEHEKELMGRGIDKDNLNVYLKQITDKLEEKDYREYDYKERKTISIDYNFLVYKLKQQKILDIDNKDFAEKNSTKTSKIWPYFYELTIEEEINDNEFIDRLSSQQKDTYYYLKFTNHNGNWDYINVKKEKEVIIKYV